jgi:glycine cleavage system H protein
MAELKYTQSHEWISAEDGVATIGITQYAVEQLGDIVFVELPQIGKKLETGAEAAVVESVKAASEVYAPLAGEAVEVNAELGSKPELVNADPEGKGWFFRMKLKDEGALKGLMTKDQYAEFIKGL